MESDAAQAPTGAFALDDNSWSAPHVKAGPALAPLWRERGLVAGSAGACAVHRADRPIASAPSGEQVADLLQIDLRWRERRRRGGSGARGRLFEPFLGGVHRLD